MGSLDSGVQGLRNFVILLFNSICANSTPVLVSTNLGVKNAVMTWLPGYGLPSTLTPERIKDVLKFAKNQERELQTALDCVAAPVWTRTAPGDDFYRRLHGMLRTADGRETYEKARRSFEGNKRAWSGRADFFGCLVDACLREALDPNELAVILRGEPQHAAIPQRLLDNCRKALARANAWEHLAEFVWASSARLKIGNDIIDALNAYPEVAPFLEEVRAGLVPRDEPPEEPVGEPTSEKDGEAAALVDDVRKAAEDLDAKRLEPSAVGTLDRAVARLVVIAKVREDRREASERLRLRFKDWRESHSEALADASELENRLAALDVQIGAGDMDQDHMETVLGLFEAALDIKSRDQEIRVPFKRAFDESDLTSVHSLATALQLLEAERNEAYVAIDKGPCRTDAGGSGDRDAPA